MQLKDNPAYKPVATSKVSGLVFYAMADITALPMDRKINLEAQMIFADGVITKELLQQIAKAAIKDLNENKSITNQAVYWNNLLYRCSYPVDEDVALRASAVCVFIEGETDKVETHWTDKKVAEMKADSELHAFFLAMGIQLVPAYRPFSVESSPSYFQKRESDLRSLTPFP